MTKQSLSQKILAHHISKKKVEPGELIDVWVDIVLANDITAPLAIKEFEKYVDKESKDISVFDTRKIVFVNDHFCPEKDIKSAEQAKITRNFSKKHHIHYFFDVGRMGIEHVLLPEQGIVMPYDIDIGADSHTCTYGGIGAFATGVGSSDVAAVMMSGKIWLKVPEAMKFIFTGKLQEYVGGKDLILHTIGDIGVDGALYKSMEFTGETMSNLPITNRLTMANMSIEAGAKNGIFVCDEKTLDYIKQTSRFEDMTRVNRFMNLELKMGEDNAYIDVKEYDASKIEPQVAYPHLPSNTKPISEVMEEKIYINQAVIGSCTNGDIDSIRGAAMVLKGKKVHKDVRAIVIPATQSVYLQAIKEGLAKIFVEANCVFSTPTCGPCLGGHMGVLAEGEKAISTTNRNFVGRMGHKESEVYLSNPAVAAASAVLGRIGSPYEVLKK